jgi:hypothetical protein
VVPSGHGGLLEPHPRYHRSVIRGHPPGLAKSGRPLQCPSRTLHVSHERVSFTFPNCYAVDNGPGSLGHRVTYLFQDRRHRTGAGAPGRGFAGLGGPGRSSLVCPGCPPAWGQLDPRDAASDRISAGHRGVRAPGAGLRAGLRGHGWGAREGLRAEAARPGNAASRSAGGHPCRPAAGGCDIQPRQSRHSYWPRPRRAGPRLFMLAQGGPRWRKVARGGGWDRGEQASTGRPLVTPIAIPARRPRSPIGHVPPAASPPDDLRVTPHISRIWCTFTGRFVRFAAPNP